LDIHLTAPLLEFGFQLRLRLRDFRGQGGAECLCSVSDGWVGCTLALVPVAAAAGCAVICLQQLPLQSLLILLAEEW